MNLSSCRELKQSVLSRALTAGKSQPKTRSITMRSGSPVSRRSAPPELPIPLAPVAAVGIAPMPGKKREFKLAVRSFRGQERFLPGVMRGLARFESEVDLVMGVRYEPRLTMRAGGSIGHFAITAGTLGGFVEDADNYYMMSNNHVFANSNFAFLGDPIIQPGPLDIGGGGSDVVGELHRFEVLNLTRKDGVDAAIATFSDAVDSFEPWNYEGIGTIEKTIVEDRFSVTNVAKRGRTTGVTTGTVSAFELDGVVIDYGENREALVVFDDQIEVIGAPPQQPFSQGGDSGSFIIDTDTMQPYALLYGGGEDENGIDRTLAHFMPDVFGRFGVTLVK